MKTYEIINYLIKNRGYGSYLEIGLDSPYANFCNVECEIKESVDPFNDTEITDDVKQYLTYRMESDKMFEEMPEDKKYDIVFVDGGHTEEQCCRDIVNSMKHLNQGGCIVVHDCIPYDELAQRHNRESEIWNGDVWKSIAKLRGRNIPFKTVDTIFGMAIIEQHDAPEFDGYFELCNLDYEKDFSKELLNTISENDFLKQYKVTKEVVAGIQFNLVAHFYIKKEWGKELPYIYKLHFECLNRYKDVFTNSIFVLAVDKDCPEDIIDFYKKKIINLGLKGDIAIKVKENTAYREGKTFKEEIVDKLGELDGLTFFIHGKGITNFDRSDVIEDSVIEWVICSYYQMFSNINQVVRMLIAGNTGVCYGPYLFKHDFCLTINNWYYSGSFQCINTKKLQNYMFRKNVRIPELCDRAYAEAFLGDVVEFNPFFVRSYKGRYATSTPLIMYRDAGLATSYILSDEKTKYNEFKNEVLSACNGD